MAGGPVRRAARGRGAGAALLVAASLAGGCVSKPVVVPQSFSIDAPAARAAAPPAGAAVLSLSRVDVASPYAGTAFVYRLGEHRIERDPYARFAASPGALLTSAVRSYLRNAGFIRDVVAPAGDLPVTATIEVSAEELCGDLSGAQAVSVLALRFRVLTLPAGTTPARELLASDYSRRVAVAEKTPAALADGWNQALSEIMQAFLGDLQPVLERSGAQ